MKKLCVKITVCAILASFTSCGSTPSARTMPEETDTVFETVSDTVSEAPADGEKSEARTERTEETREIETFSEMTETVHESAETHNEAADSELFEDDEARELWINEMAAVDNAVSELMQSEGFDDLETAEKAEKMLALINGLAANGTEEYNYPLIKDYTIYYDGDDMITFEYAGGGLGGVKLEPFDPMLN